MPHLGLSSVVLLLPLLTACPSSDPGLGSGGESGASGETETGSSSEASVDETAAGDADGAMLYASFCSPCHGVEGEGTELGYEVRHPFREFSVWVTRNGRPGDEFENSSMSLYSDTTLDDAQLEAIWDHLESFPQPTTGETLYLDYCRNCHGDDARGGVVGKDISDKDFADSRERVREGAGLGAPGERMDYMPAYDLERLSDDELQQITEYIATL